MLNALEKEIFSRREFLGREPLDTIYLGGGTPSVLSVVQLESIFQVISNNYEIKEDPEITLEANPDDMEPAYLEDLLKIGINRLSIGIQSFHEDDLRFMNRRHGENQSHNCLKIARKAGFKNINIDLIYGVPGLTMEKWKDNLDFAIGYFPEHIAAYHLTYEKGTVMDYRRIKSRFVIKDEKDSEEQYHLLVDKLQQSGYRHYEISNFARPGFISRHNSAYWKSKKYLGVGPSAHSFNGKIRRWNIAKNTSYINFVNQGTVYHEQEVLDNSTHLHEYLMTSLRTMWGIDLEYITEAFGHSCMEHCLHRAKPFLQSGKMKRNANILVLSREGMFIADHIIETLFLEKE